MKADKTHQIKRLVILIHIENYALLEVEGREREVI